MEIRDNRNTASTGLEERSAGYSYIVTSPEIISRMLRPRSTEAHKGTYGHALLIAGSTGMMGAAVLATGGALRSGCGLVSVHVPFCERQIIHVTHPSAIVSCDHSTAFSEIPDSLGKYRAVGIGCGLGQSQDTVQALGALLQTLKRMSGENGNAPAAVLDADALNIISSHPEMFRLIPSGTVLTPHLGELSRLVRSAASSGTIEWRPASGPENGFPWSSRQEVTEVSRRLAEALECTVVVKGPQTMTCPPSGPLFFNSTGNPGMAKGGSGDILTGLLTGMRARGYSATEAAILSVWFHGAAGDEAAALNGMESMNAADILGQIRVGQAVTSKTACPPLSDNSHSMP